MRVALITKGGLHIGMGHVSRSLVLADAIRDRADIVFLTNGDEIVTEYIKSFDYAVSQCENDDELIDHLKRVSTDVIIIDKLDVPEKFAKTLKESLNSKLVIFGNLTTAANKYADIVVNGVFSRHMRNRRYFDKSTNTCYFCGPKYLVLRKEFYELKKRGKKLPDKIEKILLIFGGSDPSNLSTLVLNELLKSKNDYVIDIVLGVRFEYLSEFNHVLDLYASQKRHINVYQNVDFVGELMYKADLVVCSFGASLFEALCVGTPIIGINQNSLQETWSEGLLPMLDKGQLSMISDMIVDAKYICPNGELTRWMKIGEGKNELVESIISEA